MSFSFEYFVVCACVVGPHEKSRVDAKFPMKCCAKNSLEKTYWIHSYE
jgi:hypothetical protein